MPYPRFPDTKGRYIPVALRNRIIEECGGVCFYCGESDYLTIDHIVPWVQGGTHHPMNLVSACRSCNSIAGDRLFRDVTDKINYILDRKEQLSTDQLRRIALMGRDLERSIIA